MSALVQSPAIYFKSLELQNIRCFKGQEILDLTRGDGIPTQWTLLLGDNGVGKTTLLQCLAWMRPVPEVKENKKIGIIPALHDATENAVFEKLLRNHKDGKSIIKAELIQGASLSELKMLSNNYVSIFTESTFSGKINGELDSEDSTGTRGDGDRKLPLVIAYGANRLQAKSYSEIDINNDDPVSALTRITELINVEDFLTTLDYAAVKETKGEHKQKDRLTKVKKIIAEILPGLSGKEDSIKIFGPKLPGVSSEPSGVHCETPYGWVPMSALSLGYRTTAGWTVDLACRLYSAYPDSNEPLHEPAIVLIDEIDLHLHPMWQKKIIQNISDHFPNTQFIATAHSPLMVQSANNANLAVLVTDGDHIQINNSPEFVKGWRVDQILTSELFGLTSARSEEVENKIKKRQELLQITRTSEQEKELEDINKQIAEFPSLETVIDQEALDFIKQAAKILKNKTE
ncbi:AAA family ATPase [Nitrosomonas sp. Is37]|uniref:AAA family ATPase n=1 Tax=Nitrosomonas sp. Is37 TaxID=3080535 RepID=UPI00294AC0DC|nr:AAA family ATPase [Nitrosomonas sp. Is37]MDV6345715.1 AAA family ATPase [Nitrosomonas sp. Is37]